MAALFTRKSTRPWRWTVSPITRSANSRSPRSPARYPDAGEWVRHSSASFCSSPSRRATPTTMLPRSANARAVTYPMPEEAPVTTATFCAWSTGPSTASGAPRSRGGTAPLRRRGSLITVREMRDQMTALALGLLIGAAGVVGRATAIEPGTTVDQSNVVQVKDLLPPEVYAHFKKGEYANKLFDFPNSRWSWDDGFAEATKWNAEHLVLDEHKSPIDKDTKKRPDYIRGLPFPDIR